MSRIRAWLQSLAEPVLTAERDNATRLAQQLTRARRHIAHQRNELDFYRRENQRLRDTESLLRTLLDIDDLPEIQR